MPQDSLFQTDRPIVGLRLEIETAVPYGDPHVQVAVAVRNLDGDFANLTHLTLAGYGVDFLATTVQDITHAWLYEDARAIVREVQRNDREARRHHRKHDRIGG